MRDKNSKELERLPHLYQQLEVFYNSRDYDRYKDSLKKENPEQAKVKKYITEQKSLFFKRKKRGETGGLLAGLNIAAKAGWVTTLISTTDADAIAAQEIATITIAGEAIAVNAKESFTAATVAELLANYKTISSNFSEIYGDGNVSSRIYQGICNDLKNILNS